MKQAWLVHREYRNGEMGPEDAIGIQRWMWRLIVAVYFKHTRLLNGHGGVK